MSATRTYVPFPSHRPAVAAALTGRVDAVDAALAQAEALGVRAWLDHEVTASTVRDLPDLVRFVHDRCFPREEHARIGGLRCSLAAGIEQDLVRPWWAAALATAAARAVPLEGVDLVPESSPESARRPFTSPGDFTEDLRAIYVGPGSRGVAAEFEAAMEHVGGLALFVHPASLGIPQAVLDDPDEISPHNKERVSRPARDVPWVLIDCGARPPRPELLECVVSGCRALGTEVHVAMAPDRLPDELTTTRWDYVLVLRELSPGPVESLAGPDTTIDLWILDSRLLDVVVIAQVELPRDVPLVGSLAAAAAGREGFVTLDAEAATVGSSKAGRALAGPGGHPVRRARVPGRPFTVLGIASTTLANHGAALLRDGEVVAAVQEERFTRRKQQGWHPAGRPYTTVVADPALPIGAAYPRLSMDYCLEAAGMTLDDVDVIALNGIPGRFLWSYDLEATDRPPKTVRFGRMVFVPHHLAHAASAYRVSGFDPGDTCIFTVDGRGERETAAFFEVRDDHAIERIFDIPVRTDSLIGGAYEALTLVLGFGHHGAGSTMGLAPLGEPDIDLSAFLSARSRADYSIHDRGLTEHFQHLSRHRDGPLTREQLSLAASAQQALEQTVEALLRDGLGGRSLSTLCLAGGVALNCAMNQHLRQTFGFDDVFVQPAANDAGTALGAALEAHWDVTGEPPSSVMRHAYLGPGFTDERIRKALSGFGMRSSTPGDLPTEVAQRVATGQVVCWFQGRLEYGPRALGHRSILADPRSTAVRDRVNVLKGRQWWRPFGPSILAGHEAEWFETPFDSPYMLFTVPVLAAQRDRIPAVVHVDGTTRPQSVSAAESPRYHAVISAFHAITGVPMVVNTSFNTAFEPIVCTPEDALASFLQLGADCLAIGDHLVTREALR